MTLTTAVGTMVGQMTISKPKAPSRIEMGAVLEDVRRELAALNEGQRSARDRVEQKLDEHAERSNLRLDTLELLQRHTTGELVQIKDRMARLEEKVDATCTKLDEKMDANYAKLDGKMDANHSQTEGQASRLEASLGRIESRLGDACDKLERHDIEIIKLMSERPPPSDRAGRRRG